MDIPKLLSATEGENIEFKEAKNRFDFEELVQYACAIANCGGGKIVLGVADRRPREVVGSQAFLQPEYTRKGLMDRLHIRIDFNEVTYEGKRILIFNIPSRPCGLPVFSNGVAFWRNADSLVKMPPDVLRSIYNECEDDFSASICPGATIDDLDEGAVNVFRDKWYIKSQNERLKTLDMKQLLMDCDVISSETEITYAALILFGKQNSLTKYLAQSEIIFEYRSSNSSGPAQQRKEFREAFFNIYERLWELINLRNDKQHYQDGLFVFDVPTFNERATREALLNAVSHRNYRDGRSIFILQYQDRLVIKSPGGLPYGITIDNIIDKQYPRNRRIAELFSKCGLVERSGQGMNLIYETSIKESKAMPDFTGTDDNEVCLTLNGLLLNPAMLRLINKVSAETLNSFSTKDFFVLDFLTRGKKIPSDLYGNANRMVDLGMVEKIGKSRFILSHKYYVATGKTGEYTRRKGLAKETNKELLLTHILNQKDVGTPMRELQQVLPHLSRGEIHVLLQDLAQSGKIYLTGKTRGAKWFPMEKPNE